MQSGGLREYQRADVQFLTLNGLEKRIWFLSVRILHISEISDLFSETETYVSKVL